jgi:SAM-dependent methyltransferase
VRPGVVGDGANARVSDPHPGSLVDTEPACPLCGAEHPRSFATDRTRTYLRCGACELVFVPREQHPSAADELARYELHRNSPHDAGYRAHLARLFEPLNARLRPVSRGLDFGCGPGPTLSVLFEEAGHRVALYDIFYAPDAAALARTYDFVTASEVVEHLRRPAETLDLVWSLVAPGGLLGVMTNPLGEPDGFADWWYKDDVTHLCFYATRTFAYLAGRWGASMERAARDVILYRKATESLASGTVTGGARRARGRSPRS